MLYEIYKAIEGQLRTIDGLKDVQWYNAQYESTIHTQPVAFVEFPETILPLPASKQLDQAPVRIRIHVVTKVLSRQDSAVPEAAIQENQSLATAVQEACKRFASTWQEVDYTTPLQFRGWQHWHRWRGWMVTFVELEGKMKV